VEFDIMPLLFSYGTLQQGAVQLSTFGRLLEGQPDELVGFEQSVLKIELHTGFHQAGFRETGVGVC
jgi:hypothetical protein